jgi:hypothetical protein
MLVLHDKNLGTRGDCMRACIATLLQEDPTTLPHFVNDPNEPNWLNGLNKFLATRGLFYVQVPNVRMFWPCAAGDVYHLLIGTTKRETKHAVVAMNGKMIHDPHPSREGLISNDVLGADLECGFLVKRF